MGSPFVDQIEGKREALGASRATLVSMAGFTEPALKRVGAQSKTLDAVHLRPATDDDWPRRLAMREMGFELHGQPCVHQKVFGSSLYKWTFRPSVLMDS